MNAAVSVPQHVCIIMDGNGRWAKKRLMPRTYGHKKGVDATRKAISFFAHAGVKHLTLFAFSSENWNRPSAEVESLMGLFVSSLKKNTAELHKNKIRIRFIGNRQAFSIKLNQTIAESEQLTRDNQEMILNIAANYGGQWDILQATRKIAARLSKNEISDEDINESLFANELSMAGSPEPDLFIRTGGEKRISNFLLWQLAYAELYFSDVLWPDFAEAEMQSALDTYNQRQRRFGKTGEQIETLQSC